MDTRWQTVIRRQVFLKSKGKSIMDLKAESQVDTNVVPFVIMDCLKSGEHRVLIELPV